MFAHGFGTIFLWTVSVTIDINSNAKVFSKHLEVPTLNETTTIRSLAISFSQNVISLYIDCKDVAKEEIEFNLSKLFLQMEEPNVKLFRERKYPLHLDNSVESALARASCQKIAKRRPNRKIVKDNEKSKKYYDGEISIEIAFLLYLNFFYLKIQFNSILAIDVELWKSWERRMNSWYQKDDSSRMNTISHVFCGNKGKFLWELITIVSILVIFLCLPKMRMFVWFNV